MRFSYCACAISFILNDWSGIDVELLKKYIKNCFGYQGGFGWIDYAESHAGLTYCALGCLKLISLSDKNDIALEKEDKNRLIEFLASRQQDGGF